jgi:hypothetical protein
VKANAARFGLELTPEQAFQAAMQLEREQLQDARSQDAPALDHLRSVYPDQSPVESAKFFADIKRSADQDLPGTVAWMAQQYGMHPMQVAQAIAARYANAPVPQQSFEQSQHRAEAAVQSMIDKAAETLPDFPQYEEDMEELLRTGKVKRTGDYSKDFMRAYETAKRRAAKLTPDEKLDKSLRRVYDKSNARKG